jgi:hypothetical protein
MWKGQWKGWDFKEVPMKVQFKYFKEASAQKIRKDGLKEYTRKMDQLAKSKKEFEVIKFGKDRGLVTKYGIFRVGHGNTKVFFPTINFESGLTCSSAEHCPFSFQTKRKNQDAGTPLCYAQKLEGAFKPTLYAKAYQAEVVAKIARHANVCYELALAIRIADMVKQMGSKHIRISEVGDIGPDVADFAHKVLSRLIKAGMKPYLYTKRPDIEREALEATGATVLVSETDFVCVKDEEEAKQIGLPICPGQCGGPNGCYRCPLGKKTAVIAH